MRENDPPVEIVDPAIQQKVKNRAARSYSGFVIACGATIFAFVHPEFYLQAFLIGLIGAGIIDPSFVYSKITGKE